jgi:hypothetical protein
MAIITNVILTHGALEDRPGEEREFPIIEKLNALLDRPGLEGRFAKVDRYAGGRHDMEADVYLGTFDYLIPEKLVQAVESLPWGRPSEVQLFLMGQNDSRFREVPLFTRRT